MAVSGFAGRRNIQKLDIQLVFPEEVYANTPFPLKVVVKNNKKFLPSFLIRVEIDRVSVLFATVEKTAESMVNFKAEKRGTLRIERINVCSVFPFSFFVRCSTQKVNIQKTVFPQPKKCSILHYLDDGKSHKKGEHTVNLAGYEGELISIKDHSPTTPMKYIHWKASAKSDQLKEKELSRIQSPPAIIKFDRINIPDLEEKLSCLTYTIIRYSSFNTDIFVEYEKKLYNIKLKHQRLELLGKFAEI